MDLFRHREKIESAKEELRKAVDRNIHVNQMSIQSSNKLWVSIATSSNMSVNKLLKGMAK